MSIKSNIERLYERIAATCIRVGRNPEEVNIVAVAKTVDAAHIREAVAAGIKIIGENKVQAWRKYREITEPIRWHFIGHLQTNKVKRVLEFADVIESVDSRRLAEEINYRAASQNKIIDIFVQVNTSGEASKFGISPDLALDFLHALSDLKNIRIAGLMTIGAFLPDPNQVRPCFQMLRKLKDSYNARVPANVRLNHLSMGMTDDFELAIEEGATLIRIGRAIFGERKNE
jgi:pyridoxal phosphate enzyme (YggS family)